MNNFLGDRSGILRNTIVMTKKVAILGYGLEGQSAYKYFSDLGFDITVFDQRQPEFLPKGGKLEVGHDVFDNLKGYDLVLRSPSIRPDSIKTDGEITSVTNEFFKHCPTKNIIGITGSKGKGTTSTLIYKMLQKASKRVHLGGNIGVPALDLLPDIKPDDIVVLELSSFQLWDLKYSPHIAVVLMVEPEHLDVHAQTEEYLDAKSGIVAHQNKDDLVIYLPDNEYTKKIANKGIGQKITYSKAPGAHIENEWIVMADQKICPINQVKLPGKHNLDNACAAITAVWQYSQDIKSMATVLKTFDGLEHRLKLIREVASVKYYDDSIATTPGSAIAAIKAFEEPKILILGGSDKGADFTELAQNVAKSGVRQVILIGQMRFKLEDALLKAGFEKTLILDEQQTMQAIVEHAAKTAKPGDVVVLSPACASFGMFKNYKDRGEQFIKAVKALP